MWRPTTWADVKAALNVLSEGSDLDFKDRRALGNPGEVAKDIAAMSLFGGTLVYGIDEQNELAVGITALPLSGQVNRVQQIADTAIRPPVNVDVRSVEDPAQSGHGVLVVVVPASLATPHMAADRYPARSGTTTRYLSEPEVERLYEQRRGFVEGEETRNLYMAFVPIPGQGPPIPVADAMGRLHLSVEPVVPHSHPLGPRVGQPLIESVRLAREQMQAIGVEDSHLLDQIEGWEPMQTSGWMAGNAPSQSLGDVAQARDLGVFGSATYTYAGTLSFAVATVVNMGTGARCAYESLWAKETLASLAVAGNFYRSVPGVTFVDVGLVLQNLEGAQSEKLFKGAYLSKPRQVEVVGYDESRRFPVAELASDPRNAARSLLDRLFVSFLGEGADVVTELSRPRS
jgi:hypothetical protein